jgi:hypothetical protein
MASSGNTWCKKLMNKQRLHVLKVKGVKARFAVEARVTSEIKKIREFNAPKREGFVPRGFGRRRYTPA